MTSTAAAVAMTAAGEGEVGGLGAPPPPSYCFNMSAVTDAEREADEAVVFWVEGVALGMVATAGVIGRQDSKSLCYVLLKQLLV